MKVRLIDINVSAFIDEHPLLRFHAIRIESAHNTHFRTLESLQCSDLESEVKVIKIYLLLSPVVMMYLY